MSANKLTTPNATMKASPLWRSNVWTDVLVSMFEASPRRFPFPFTGKVSRCKASRRIGEERCRRPPIRPLARAALRGRKRERKTLGEELRNPMLDGFGRFARVGRVANGPADDDVVGSA